MHHLPAAEAGLIKAMLKLLAAGSRGGFQWQFSDTAPYDVVIVDANSVDVGTPRVKAMAPASLVLFESGAAAEQPSSRAAWCAPCVRTGSRPSCWPSRRC